MSATRAIGAAPQPLALAGKVFVFSRKDGSRPISDQFTLLEDGSIAGYIHRNERFWKLDGDALCLMNDRKIVTARLEVGPIVAGKLMFSGPHLPRPAIILSLSERVDRVPGDAVEEVSAFGRPGTREALAREIRDAGWKVGKHTYGVPGFIERGEAKFFVGSFCSIAAGVRVSLGDHRSDTVTSFPFATLRRHWPGAPKVKDHSSKGDVRIGNDVWIGTGALILSGVTIGDGAVIGANTVVAKDVPPYAVCVGNPGRVARFRFSDAIISELLAIEWWNWPDHTINDHLRLMLSDDIEAFIAAAKRRVP